LRRRFGLLIKTTRL